MNNRVYDITAYGAVGDGKTDCTAAIQSALDAASQAGGLITVPPGTYATGELHMRGTGITLQGCSGWGYHAPGCSVLQLNDPTAGCLLDITGAFGCTVQGVGFVGGDLGKNIHGIRIAWPDYNGAGREDTPAIDDCRIAGFTGDGLHLSHVWAFSLRHSMLIFNGGAGLYIDGFDGFISDTIFNNNGRGGVLGGGTASSLTFTGNRIEWNQAGGILIPQGNSHNITGNFFDRAFGPAIAYGPGAWPCEMLTITGNVFRRSGAYTDDHPLADPEDGCHIRMTGCRNAVVTGNTMRIGAGDRLGGEVTPAYSLVITDCRHCILRDNVLDKGALKAQLVEHGDNSTCVITENIGDLAHSDG